GDESNTIVVRAPSGEMFHVGGVRTTPLPTVTGLIEDYPPDDRALWLNDAHAAVVAMRVAMNQKKFVSEFHDEFLPQTLEALDGVDQLVLAGNRVAHDAAALVAIRQWLAGGGRLWIMLDRVAPETVALLLEDAWTCQIVDRVSLTTVAIEGVTRETRHVPVEPRDFEEPVEFVRVLPSGVSQSFQINGWPAAFWQRVGDGHVLFTTLAARGWTRPRDPNSHVSDELLFSGVVGVEPFQYLAAEFVRPRETAAVAPEVWRPMLEDQIGYQILSRRTVFGVLGGFCGVLFAAGIVLARCRRLEWLRWIAPGAALTAAAALLLGAHRLKQEVPATVSVGQFAQAAPGTSDVVVTGLAALYHQQQGGEPLAATSGGVVWPDMQGLSGTTRRMVWTDLDRWHWQNLKLPPGVRAAPMQFAARLNRPLEARARFGPEGLTGRLETGPFAQPADALIATPARMRLAIRLKADGTFSAGPSDVLAPGDFVASGLLSDEQRRRQSVYRRLFTAHEDADAVDPPKLFVWAEPLDPGFEFSAADRRAGSALLSIPLAIEPTPPGTRVRIPPAFIPYRAGPGPGEEAFASAYSNRNGRWSDKSGYAENWLRFQMPESLLPLELKRVRLTLNIGGPARRIEIAGVANGERVSLESRLDPVGTLHFDVDRPDVLATDASGGLLLGVLVGPVGDTSTGLTPEGTPEIRDRWKIEYLRLEAEGETQP
ncbi:MAG TPA: hypothetical protein VML55_17450, partial [Planctomycetaceae bacterium]|nr:hypothetical protein [Planctomycetaceae bacterium]